MRVYEWFLELPVAMVLVVLWFAGLGVLGLFGLALYACWILLRMVVAT